MNVRIVLLQTFHPGNIGAAARAMLNMGLNDLVLVRPREFPSPEATARAGQATTLLDNARVVDELSDAIADCGWVIGTSARAREFRLPQGTPRTWAPDILNESRHHSVAIVFGRERMGLHNDEIQQCHGHMIIPANPEYPVLNLAQALQIICYELFQAHQNETEATVPAPENLPEYPENQALEAFYARLESALEESGFLSRDPGSKTMLRLQTLFKRARPTRKELNVLMGAVGSLARSPRR